MPEGARCGWGCCLASSPLAAGQLHCCVTDLISFLKAIPDGFTRHRVRYPQIFLILVAVLGILSGCYGSRVLETFAGAASGAAEPGAGADVQALSL
jgi:hypothetical protein